MRQRFGSERRTIVAAALVAAVLVWMSAVAATSHRAEVARARDRALTSVGIQEAELLRNHFERARTAILLTARNPAFVRFYEAPGERMRKVEAGGVAISDATAALAYLEQLYPSSIGEACFIDRGGEENARVVRGHVAGIDELSPDETGASFFAPTFRMPVGDVYQARPYVSPDTREWVVANSTLVPMPDGSRRAIVHFEVTVESLRHSIAMIGEGQLVQIVDARTGRVIIDSSAPQKMDARLGPSEPVSYGFLRTAPDAGHADVGSNRVSWVRLEPEPGNANEWYIVVSEPLAAAARLDIGPVAGTLATAAVAVIAAALVLIAWRRRRDLADDLAELREVDEMKGLILDAVSHELRTPLTSILGNTSLLQQDQVGAIRLSADDRGMLVEGLVRSARKLMRLLTELLDVNRLIRGIHGLVRCPTDVPALAAAVVDEIAGDRVVILESQPFVAVVDASKTERILENLISNAIKYAPGDTPIVVRLVPEVHGGLRIEVIDRGPGVPPEMRRAIFEPFLQGDNRHTHSPGIGLGLAVVARFAALHGGTAHVDEAEGGGAHFVVTLPGTPDEMSAPSGADRHDLVDAHHAG